MASFHSVQVVLFCFCFFSGKIGFSSQVLHTSVVWMSDLSGSLLM